MSKKLEKFFGDAKNISLQKMEKQAIAEKIGIQVRERFATRPTPHMNEKQFFKAANVVCLSPAERVRCKEYILESIAKPSAFWWLASFKHASSLVAAVLVVTLTGGAGATYASESAMPGDMLYSVKINISEPLQKRFARNAEARAKFAAKRAERRLLEAEKLEQDASIDDKMKVMITERFREHAEEIEEQLRFLEDNNQQTVAGAIGMDFEATLRGHSLLFERMNQENPRMKELMQEVHIARMQAEEVNIRTNLAAADKNDNRILLTVATKHAEETLRKTVEKLASQTAVSDDAKKALSIAEEALAQIKEGTAEGTEVMELMRIAIRNAREAAVLAKETPKIAEVDGASASPSAVIMMKHMEEPSDNPVASPLEARIRPDSPDDMHFSTEVRMQMTKKKLRRLKESIDHQKPLMNENAKIDLEIGIGGAEEQLSIAETEENAGNALEALNAADKALRHADTVEKRMRLLEKTEQD